MSLETAASRGGKSRFGFVAKSGDENEVNIVKSFVSTTNINYWRTSCIKKLLDIAKFQHSVDIQVSYILVPVAASEQVTEKVA